MNITKIKIKNLFGIKEYEADGRSLELSGKNGTGKSSVLDAIKYALTNKSDREYIVHKGETEGEIIVETDTGLSIDRKSRTNKADYKSVKRNGLEVGSPEAFLRELFMPLQLNPIEFMKMDKKQQNAIILDMIDYPWDMNKIKEWFGEIPAWVSYDQSMISRRRTVIIIRTAGTSTGILEIRKHSWKKSRMEFLQDMTLRNGRTQVPVIFTVRSSVCREKTRPLREPSC